MKIISPLDTPATLPGLRPLTAAIANRDNACAKIVVVGDSVSEGEGVPTYDKRWLYRLQEMLRGAFPTAGVRGGAGFFPTHYISTSLAAPCVIDLSANHGNGAATAAVEPNYGLGGRGRQLAKGAALEYTQECTSFTVHWVRSAFGVPFNVLVDGVQTMNVQTNGALQGGFVSASPQLTPGKHVIRIVTTDTTLGFISDITGVEFFYGDENKGIRVYDATRSGASAFGPSFTTEHFRSITAVAPQAVIIQLVTNDAVFFTNAATFKTNLQSVVTNIQAALTAVPGSPATSIIFMAVSQPNGAILDTWANYLRAIKEVAAATTNGVFINMAHWLGPTVAGNNLGLWADGVHLSVKGHSVCSDRFMHGLGLIGGGESRLGGNKLHTMVDFGNFPDYEDNYAQVTIADPYIQSSSVINATVTPAATPDHDPEDAVVEGLVVSAGNIIPNTSYDLYVYAPEGTWGRYLVASEY